MTKSRRPRHTRRDTNQQEIVDDLRRLGFYVLDLADVGGRVLDLLICGRNANDEWQWLAVEIKTFAGRLTSKQRQLFAEWPDLPAIVAQRAEDVLRWYGRIGEADNEINSGNPDKI